MDTPLLDFSLFKNTPINERTTAQLRFEFFNLPNHTQLGRFPGTSFNLDPTASFGVYRKPAA